MFKLGATDAYRYRTQDLRRGHAQDMKKAGATDDDLREHGQWKSQRGFVPYVDWPEAECDKVADAHANMEATAPETALDTGFDAEIGGVGLDAELQRDLEDMLASDDDV